MGAKKDPDKLIYNMHYTLLPVANTRIHTKWEVKFPSLLYALTAILYSTKQVGQSNNTCDYYSPDSQLQFWPNTKHISKFFTPSKQIVR